MAVAGLVMSTAGHMPAHAAEELLRFTDPQITESSGLAWDPDRQLYWTVNDSGDTGRIFGVGLDGQTQGVHEFNAPVQDVEALARSADGRLYVGDIGDNDAVRENITVYYFDNPSTDGGDGSYRAWDFVYPDGPHDAEAMYLGQDGRLHIVTKEESGGIYVAPEEPSASGVNELQRIGDASAFVTDAVALPDGAIALRTYSSVEVLVPDLLTPNARAALPFQPQGETIALHPEDPAWVVVGSEGDNQPLLHVALPTSIEENPPADAEPPPSPTPQPDPEEQALEEGIRSNRSGTLIALLLALVAALAAGAHVWRRAGSPEDATKDAGGSERSQPVEDTAVLGRRDPDRGYPIDLAPSTSDDLMPRPPQHGQPGAPPPGEQPSNRAVDQSGARQDFESEHSEDDAERTIARPEDWWR